MPGRRIAFVLIDGLGDVSIPELGNRTPLEAAHTPHLDAIAGAVGSTAQALLHSPLRQTHACLQQPALVLRSVPWTRLDPALHKQS